MSLWRKEVFDVSDKTLYLLLIRLTDGEHPEMYVIPAYAWMINQKRHWSIMAMKVKSLIQSMVSMYQRKTYRNWIAIKLRTA